MLNQDFSETYSQLTFTHSKSIIETLEKRVKCIQSELSIVNFEQVNVGSVFVQRSIIE